MGRGAAVSGFHLFIVSVFHFMIVNCCNGTEMILLCRCVSCESQPGQGERQLCLKSFVWGPLGNIDIVPVVFIEQQVSIYTVLSQLTFTDFTQLDNNLNSFVFRKVLPFLYVKFATSFCFLIKYS